MTAAPDQDTTIADLRQAVRRFVTARDWDQYHTPKNLAMSIAIEAGEIMEHFQWYTPEQVQARLADEQERFEVAEELADVLIYCLSFANSVDIDVTTAVLRKLERNESRFPVATVRGRLGND